MWFRFALQRKAQTHRWAAFGPLQVIWRRPDAGPVVWLTTDKPRKLYGRFPVL